MKATTKVILLISITLSLFFYESCKKETVTKNDEEQQQNNNDSNNTSFDSTYGGETTDKALRILVISDLNSSYGSTSYASEVGGVMDKVSEINPDIVLCGGDMIAGQSSSLSDDQVKAMWTSFDNNIRKKIVDLGFPFGFTVGNHDASPSYSRDRQLAQEYWDDPAHKTNLKFVDSTHFPIYYSYIKNNVFIISWDAAGPSQVTPEIKTWLQQQLSTNIAVNARLRILLGHLPLYPVVSDKNNAGEVLGDADNLRDFLVTNGVSLYISGHQHAYYPAHKEGLQLLNLGALGSGPRVVMSSNQASAIKTYTVIDIPVLAPETFTYNTYKPSSSFQLFDPTTLPDSVVGFNGFVKRRDIAE